MLLDRQWRHQARENAILSVRAWAFDASLVIAVKHRDTSLAPMMTRPSTRTGCLYGIVDPARRPWACELAMLISRRHAVSECFVNAIARTLILP